MANIKEEPFSDEEWNQIFKDLPQCSDVSFPDSHHDAAGQAETSANSAANLSLDQPVSPFMTNMDYPAATADVDLMCGFPEQASGMSSNSPQVHPETGRLFSEVQEIKISYDMHANKAACD